MAKFSLEKNNKKIFFNNAEFNIQRDPAGRPEQFRSKLELFEPALGEYKTREISVNHPLRFKGMTKIPIEQVIAGAIICIAGLNKASVSDTICDNEIEV